MPLFCPVTGFCFGYIFYMANSAKTTVCKRRASGGKINPRQALCLRLDGVSWCLGLWHHDQRGNDSNQAKRPCRGGSGCCTLPRLFDGLGLR